MANGLNESTSIIGEVLPLLYFSQAFEQSRLREDQNRLENTRQEEALALRQREETRQQEAFTLSKAELAAKILPDLPTDQQEQLYNEAIRKPFGLAPVSAADMEAERGKVEAFRGSLSSERDPQTRMQNLRSFIGTLRSRGAITEASSLAAGIEGEAAAEAIIPASTDATPEATQRTTARRNFVALMPRKDQADLFKSVLTSKTITDTEQINRVVDLRTKFDSGDVTPETLNEEAVLSGSLNLPAYSPVANDYRKAVGRQLTATKFAGDFGKEVSRVERGLAQWQPVADRGSLKPLDALNTEIATLERGSELSLTDTYKLTRLKDQRSMLQRTIFQSGIGIAEPQREQAIQKIRQDIATLEPAIANLKKQKGVPGAESQLHAFEAVRDAWSVQLDALTNPSSQTVANLTKSREKLVQEQAFWAKEQADSEKQKDRLTRVLVKSGQDKQLTERMDKEAKATGQQEFGALPKEQQTPQKAAEIAKRLTEETGVPVEPDDLLKAAKDPNRAAVEVNLGKGLPEEISKIASESRASAMSAIETTDAANRIEQAIEGGEVNLGPTATIRNKVDQFAQLVGVGGENTAERLVNTRNTIRGLAQFAVGARKALKGQGQVSDFEGKLLIKAEAGEIDDMTLPELKAFLGVTRRLADRQYKSHQDLVGRMRKMEGGEKAAPFFEVGELPKRQASPKAESASGYVETRRTKDGRLLGKKADGTIEEIR